MIIKAKSINEALQMTHGKDSRSMKPYGWPMGKMDDQW